MNEPPSRNPTLDDVAALAGVSTATVSRYLNNPKVVAQATAARIAEAIGKTGYIPNLLAGGLASSRSKMVAVLIPHLTDSIFNDTIQTMAEQLAAAGSTVMMGLSGVDSERTDELILAAMGRRVDAIISTAPLGAQTRALVGRFPGLFIQIWELPDDPPGLAVGFSHEAVGRDVARFVHSRGYQRPLLVTAQGARARVRSAGFQAEWASLRTEPAGAGQAVAELAVDIPSRFGHARRLFAQLRRHDPMPDVVVCGSDYLAQGLIVEAQAAGLRVPEDLAVIGFGNASLAGDMRPTITTIDIDGARIAREAIAAIRQHEAGMGLPCRKIDVGFRLIARESA